MKATFDQSKQVRAIAVPITGLDTAQTDLFTLPAGSRILSITYDITVAFNGGNTLVLGTKATAAKFVAAAPCVTIDTHNVVTMIESPKFIYPTIITGSISDGTIPGGTTFVTFTFVTDIIGRV